MEHLKKVFYTTVLIFVIYSSALSQGYLSKYVPLGFLPNTTHFEYSEDSYKVYSINFINGVSASTIIEIDRYFDTIRTTTHLNISIGRFGPIRNNDVYYGYARDRTNVNRHILIQMDNDFQEIKRDSFYPENRSFNANCMTMMSDKIIGGSWDYIECPEQNDGKCEYMNYKIIDTDGNELNSIDIGREHPYFFSFEVDYTEEGNIICGGNRQGGGTRATVYNFDLEGNTNWSYESPDKQSRNNVPVYTEELSNGDIVYTDKLDKGWDDEYLENLWSPQPAQLVWLSPDGERLFSFLDTLNWKSGSEFSGLLRGKGDYFFVYGEESIGNLVPTEYDGRYGSLMKWSNDGQLIWRRLYRHLQDDDADPIISHIIEHENGDISTLGSEVSDAGYFMWMTRLNEYGCLDDVDCDLPMVLPTEEVALSNDQNYIKLYPNPVVDILRIESSEIPSKVEIYTIDGSKLYDIRNTKQIDVSRLRQGLYIARIVIDERQIIRKFMKK